MHSRFAWASRHATTAYNLLILIGTPMAGKRASLTFRLVLCAIQPIVMSKMFFFSALRVFRMPCLSTSAGRLCNTTHLIWASCLRHRCWARQSRAAKPHPQHFFLTGECSRRLHGAKPRRNVSEALLTTVGVYIKIIRRCLAIAVDI